MSSRAAKRITATTTQAPEPAFRRSSGRVTYTKRLTLEITDEQHAGIRDQLTYGASVNGWIRAAIDHVLADEALAKQVTAEAAR